MLAELLHVVICTFNAEEHLRGCLESVVAQKDPQIRIWVMDGESSDATHDIVRSFGPAIDCFDARPDEGVYDAMNRAVALVEDGWVLFLGADDRLMPNAIRALRTHAPKAMEDVSVLYGDVYRPGANVLYDGPFSKWKLVRRNICQQAILYRTKALQALPFDIRFKINADHVLNLALMLQHKRFQYIPVCLAYYEDVHDGISRDRADQDFIPHRRAAVRKSGDLLLYFFTYLIDAKEAIRRAIRGSKCGGR